MQKFFKTKKFYVLCGIAVVLCAFMIRSAIEGNSALLVSRLAGGISRPFLEASANFTDALSGFFSKYFKTAEVYEENETLKEQIRDLQEQLVDYESVKRENEQYKDYLGLREENPDYDFETASVIGRDSTGRFGSFTIDKGSSNGIAVADPVITADGLVGLVWEVGPTWARVRTILDSSVEVGAYDIRTRDSGIVSGDILLSEKGMCQMVSLPRDSGASAGDLIVTSGIGGVFPKNLVVGTLSEISLSGSGLSLTASVTPAADIASVTDVLVIKSFRGQGEEDLSSLPEDSSGTESTSGTEDSSETENSSGAEESGTESGAAP
ncbi:MAG TPA: rod shape-determining protein MreC [Oscillospiraceae bacterium]|nr:rod shape-determining protein MreC [Oscillospiraceae bacterium]HQQ89961.1 rod shape-determining protein MreC [Oscillospiraceae bacterium]HRW57609.1 rod shape-determining protein MreC [Oscillospiraceae bacterium]